MWSCLVDAWQRVVEWVRYIKEEWVRYIKEEWDAALDILVELPSALV